MFRAKPKLVLGGVVLLLALGVFYKITRPAEGTLAYHLASLAHAKQDASWRYGPRQQVPAGTGKSLPANTVDYFKPRVWLWFLTARQTITSRVNELERHQQALIRLGSFERREFLLTNIQLDAAFWPKWGSGVSNAPFTNQNWMLHLDDQRPDCLRITADRRDIPIFQQLIGKLDSATP